MPTAITTQAMDRVTRTEVVEGSGSTRSPDGRGPGRGDIATHLTTRRDSLRLALRSRRALTALAAMLALLVAGAASPISAVASNGWSAPTMVDPSFLGDDLGSSVSCPSSSFCAAVDNHGDAVTYNGTSWSSIASIAGLQPLVDVSCTSSAFCVAVSGESGSGEDEALVYNGTSWTPYSNIDFPGGLASVSCASSTFCVAVDSSGNALTYNGASWREPVSIDSGKRIDSISCPTGSFCVAVDESGNAVTDKSGTWSAPASIDKHGLASISCSSSSFCLAVSFGVSDAITYNGTSWSAPTSTGLGLYSVSCASSTFCAGMTLEGAATYNGISWSAETRSGFESSEFFSGMRVSCAAESFCATITSAGTPVTYNGTSWSPGAHIGNGGVRALSCPETSFCAATDGFGGVLFDSGGTWGTRTVIDASTSLRTISCTSSAFCAAGGSTDLLIDHSGAWTKTSNVLKREFNEYTVEGVSCASESFCVAVGGPLAAVYNATKWEEAASVGSGLGLSSVSCPTSTFCMAGDGAGRVVAYSGGTWGAPTKVDTGELTAVSCSSPSFCGATDNVGDVLTYSSGKWSEPVQPGAFPTGTLSSVSCVPSFCRAGGNVYATFTYENGAWSEDEGINFGDWILVSCPTSSSCIAADRIGRAFTSVHTPTPTVTSVSPLSGPSSGGTTVTIKGTHLGGATLVRFGTSLAPIKTDSETEITVKAPPHEPGTVDVSVTTAGGTSAISETDRYTYTSSAPQPTVSGVSPSGGPTVGGTHVTIAGTNLEGATAVHFGGVEAEVKSDSAGEIVAVSPAQPAGPVDVTVTTPAGTSAISEADRFTYEGETPPPVTHTLSVAIAGTGSGTVTGSGISCSGACSGTYAAGTTVTLTASAASSSTFAGWGGACSGTGACVVTLTSDATVTATFNAERRGPKAPELGKSEVVGASGGVVKVRRKGSAQFVVISAEENIPAESEVDATNGRVTVTAATRGGGTQSAEVYGGRFSIRQDASGEVHFLLTLVLTGCPKTRLPAGASTARILRGPKVRHLWVTEAGGKWGTSGRYVSTSVEGTTWLVQDECSRSTVKVTQGKVKVRDLVKRTVKTITAGGTYVALAKRHR
jgi:IPT/TIG domain/Divergent InlB B-repeat domain